MESHFYMHTEYITKYRQETNENFVYNTVYFDMCMLFSV